MKEIKLYYDGMVKKPVATDEPHSEITKEDVMSIVYCYEKRMEQEVEQTYVYKVLINYPKAPDSDFYHTILLSKHFIQDPLEVEVVVRYTAYEFYKYMRESHSSKEGMKLGCFCTLKKWDKSANLEINEP
jgi:hypothetical protein